MTPGLVDLPIDLDWTVARGAGHRDAEGVVRSASEPAPAPGRPGGAWYEDGGELAWEGLGHLGTSEVGEVLERLVRSIERHLRRCGLLGTFGDEAEPDGEGDPEGNLAASAVSGQTPPAGLSG